ATVSPEGVPSPAEVRQRASSPELHPPRHGGWRRLVPDVMKTGINDVQRIVRSRRFRADIVAVSGPADPQVVWQRHEAFCDAGAHLSQQLGVPLVISVPAPLEWESRQWGVRRPGWTGLFREFARRRAVRPAGRW